MEGGEITERGDHEQLLDVDGRYAALWSVQAGAVDFERRAEVLPED
jgi:ABC-type multidrug transport system fused ATPase/permease subunit